ncbi:growth hormone secretagogue receptor type 1-like [Limanda limanda]|uniref:growth hormone secretagogue receptor type 1-like n=1 Tax=Limanda limanda TaxID=27771 RepID=UPI0029C6A972|nr:growth hormone secretagogue receptor type 1-like [Limanda limanda]
MEVTIVKEVDDMGREVEKEMCDLSTSSVPYGLLLVLYILYDLYFLVPLCILGLVSILIGRTLRLRTQISHKHKSHQHAVKMLGVIFLAFVVCWLPYIIRLTIVNVSFRAGLNISLIIFSLFGNTLTLLVVWLRPNMRRSTYLYLSSMAVSDVLILLLLALDILQFWIDWNLGVFICKLTMLLSQCCSFCTILHITFLSLERYLLVCWPITSKTLVTRRRTRALIGCLWLGAAVGAAPFLAMTEVDYMGKEEEIKVCRLSISSVPSGLMWALLILYDLYFLVPLCILGLVFILIGRTLRLCPQSSRKDKSHQHAVKMLVWSMSHLLPSRKQAVEV